MDSKLTLFNTLTRKKEVFEPLNAPYVGMYVCGPTVYSDSHLGHARPAITFDILFRYLKHLGYKVRYVRNITDVGHLENEAQESGEDKIAKKARLEQLEPMEVVQHYVNSFRYNMAQLNVLPPSIEPHASGHIIEQQLMVAKILKNGFAYESNGSIYFDVEKYNKKYQYGKLSGRVLDDLLENTRELEGSQEKKSSFDFALWKKASPEHIMQWPSQWGNGFPGWHLECSVMSTKYLGEKFDIHGGGMDLMFPHHECEIAQNVAASGAEAVKYWLHNNMITINGQKMARSLGNFITLNDLFTGNNKLLAQAYSPMTIRFFILQAQYRGTVDFSNEALLAAEKGLQRLMNAMVTLEKLQVSDKSSVDVSWLENQCFDALNDDLNTPVAIANLFEGVRWINSIASGTESISQPDLEQLNKLFTTLVTDILGLKDEIGGNDTNGKLIGDLITLVLNMRMDAKSKKDFAASDRIRDELAKMGVMVKDKKDGFDWEIK
jgi:cysteinyl-tRNA synthetase